MGVEGEKLKDIVGMFKEENPDIDITVQAIPWGQAHEKLITAVAGGLPPDLCQLGTTWVPEFVTLKVLEPLDSYLQGSTSVSKDKYFKGSWETGTIGENVFSIPWYVDTRLLFYRKDILNQFGFSNPPRTWDELMQVCQKLVQKDKNGDFTRTGLLLPQIDTKTLLTFFWSNGGDVFSPDGKIIINSPENREAFDFYAGFFQKGLTPKVSKGGMELYNNFKSGFLCMFFGGPWMLKDLDTYAKEITGKWDVAVLPRKKSGTSFVGGSNWAIFKESRNKRAAWKFVEFMSRPDIQIQWYQMTSDLPSRLDAWEDKFFEDKKMVKTFGQQLFDTRTPPRIQQWEEIEGEVNLEMERVTSGKMTSQEALEKIERKIVQIFKKR